MGHTYFLYFLSSTHNQVTTTKLEMSIENEPILDNLIEKFQTKYASQTHNDNKCVPPSSTSKPKETSLENIGNIDDQRLKSFNAEQFKALKRAILYIISVAAKIEHKKQQKELINASGFHLTSGNLRCEEFGDPTNYDFNFAQSSTSIRNVSEDLAVADNSMVHEFDTESQRVLMSWLE